MRLHELAVLTALALSIAACKKDDDPPTPSPAPTTASMKLDVTFRNGAGPFDHTVPFTDGSGRSVRITKFRFYTQGLHLTDDEGDTVVDRLSSIHLVDMTTANSFDLGTIAPGHVHNAALKLGLDPVTSIGYPDQTTAPPPLDDADMTWAWNVAMGRVFVKLEGFVDANGDNIADSGEGFEYHGIGPNMVQVDWHEGFHADVAAGTTLTIPMVVDVNFLVSGLGLAGLFHNDDAEVQELLQRLGTSISVP